MEGRDSYLKLQCLAFIIRPLVSPLERNSHRQKVSGGGRVLLDLTHLTLMRQVPLERDLQFIDRIYFA